MFERTLGLHEALDGATRLPLPARTRAQMTVAEWLILAGAGTGAACASLLLDFQLRIPGHAILRAAFPMALGYALVPRRSSGMLMGASAAVTVGLFWAAGHDGGSPGALTSLLLLGPLLDLSLWGARPGIWLYVRVMLAALTANGLAFAIRLLAATWLGDGAHGQNILRAWPAALASYIACGAFAGLVSAAAWFGLGKRPRAN